MTIHEVQASQDEIEDTLTFAQLTAKIDRIEFDLCNVTTEDEDSDAFTDALDDDGIEWRIV